LGGLNWKITLIKGKKKTKRMRVKLKKIKQQKIWLKDKIERKNASTKLQGIKIEIKKKWEPKWKTKHMKNCNWMT
jgi:hypothetical protein